MGGGMAAKRKKFRGVTEGLDFEDPKLNRVQRCHCKLTLRLRDLSERGSTKDETRGPNNCVWF